jgi:hypothetical protein
MLVCSAVPAVTLTDWSTSAGAQRRQLRFTDRSGEHVVTFALSKERQTKDGDETIRSRELTITHLLGKTEVFKARDFVQACAFDLSLEVVEGSIQLTDLDEDGEPEVSFVYALGCRSDVSPRTAKLLLYEGATKYALRGQTVEQVGENEFAGGAFEADPAFKTGPKAFLSFATSQWKKHVGEVR